MELKKHLDIMAAFNETAITVMLASSGENAEVIRGCTITDTAISTPIKWSSPAEQFMKQALSQGTQTAIKLLSTVTSMKMFSIEASVKQWVGTAHPTLTIPLVFIALHEADDVTVPINKLYKYVFPTGGMLVYPPGGYSASPLTGAGITTPDGVLSLAIGRWFRAMNLMIIEGNPSPTYSKECLRNGMPLWASVNLTLTTWRMLTYEDWLSCFTSNTIKAQTLGDIAQDKVLDALKAWAPSDPHTSD